VTSAVRPPPSSFASYIRSGSRAFSSLRRGSQVFCKTTLASRSQRRAAFGYVRRMTLDQHLDVETALLAYWTSRDEVEGAAVNVQADYTREGDGYGPAGSALPMRPHHGQANHERHGRCAQRAHLPVRGQQLLPRRHLPDARRAPASDPSDFAGVWEPSPLVCSARAGKALRPPRRSSTWANADEHFPRRTPRARMQIC
jgi:hypothetical protein